MHFAYLLEGKAGLARVGWGVSPHFSAEFPGQGESAGGCNEQDPGGDGNRFDVLRIDFSQHRHLPGARPLLFIYTAQAGGRQCGAAGAGGDFTGRGRARSDNSPAQGDCRRFCCALVLVRQEGESGRQRCYCGVEAGGVYWRGRGQGRQARKLLTRARTQWKWR